METSLAHTEEFAMSRTRHLCIMLLNDALGFGLAYLAIGIVAIILAFILGGGVMALAALGLWLFIGTFLMIFLFIVYGFNPVTACNVSPHTIHLQPEGLKIKYPESERELSISSSDIGNYKIYPGGVVIPVYGKIRGWLWLPPSIFDTAEEFQNFLSQIYRRNESDSR